MKLLIAAKCLLLLSLGQDALFPNSHGIGMEIGPFGYPSVVDDVFGQWRAALKAYEDPNVAVFVADFTTVDWLYQNGMNFQKKGVYAVALYFFYNNDKLCRSRLTDREKVDQRYIDWCRRYPYRIEKVVIDTRLNTIISLNELHPGRGGRLDGGSLVGQLKIGTPVPLADRAPEMRKAVAVITANVHKLVDGHDLSKEF